MTSVESPPKKPEEKPKVRIMNPEDIESAPDETNGASGKKIFNQSSRSNSDVDQDSVSSVGRQRRKSNMMIIGLIIFLGAATCAAFLALGITAAKKDQEEQFTRRADDIISRMQRSWEDYVTAAAWVHGRCRGRNFTRNDFRRTYEYLIASGLQFQALQFDPNITNDQRPAAEEEARKFYEENYPSVDYRGFVGFNFDNSTQLDPRNESAYYFPIHYMEPVVGNERAIDLDYHASGSRKRTVLFAIDNGLPALTDRLVLVQETTKSAYGVVLMHPGYPLSDLVEEDEVWPRDLASIVIRIPDLIRRAAVDTGISSAVYIYDASDSGGVPRFLGAAEILVDSAKDADDLPEIVFLQEVELDELRQIDTLYTEETIEAANKDWIVVVHSLDGSYQPDLVFVILGGVIIFVASAGLAYWVLANTRRMDEVNRMRSQAEGERAALILENARKATKAERELNDFIAHEVCSHWHLADSLFATRSSTLTHFPCKYPGPESSRCRHVSMQLRQSGRQRVRTASFQRIPRRDSRRC